MRERGRGDRERKREEREMCMGAESLHNYCGLYLAQEDYSDTLIPRARYSCIHH